MDSASNVFWVCLLSLSIVSSRFTHDGAGVRVSFLFKVEWHSSVCVRVCVSVWVASPSVHPSVHTWVASSFLAIMSDAAVNTDVQIRPWFQSFGVFVQKRNCWVLWSFSRRLEEPPYCFPQRPYHFTFPPAVHKVQISPNLCRHLLLPRLCACWFCFLFNIHPNGRKGICHCGFNL